MWLNNVFVDKILLKLLPSPCILPVGHSEDNIFGLYSSDKPLQFAVVAMTGVGGLEIEGEGAVILIVPASKDHEDRRLFLVAVVERDGLEGLNLFDVDPACLGVGSEQLRPQVHENDLAIAFLVDHDEGLELLCQVD